MSYEATTWAVNEGATRKLEPAKRLILMVMANRADETGYLYPSMAWIQHRTGLDRRTIQRHIAAMVADGLMSRVNAKAESGAQTSNDWQLSMPQPGLPFTAQGGRHHAAGGAAPRRGGGGTTPPNKKDYTKEVSIKPIAQDFARFWAAYPRKRSKGAAEKTFGRLKPDADLLDQMLESLDRAKRSADWVKDAGQFIPYPATWLNAKGWEDEIDDKRPAEPCNWPGCRHGAIGRHGKTPACEGHLQAYQRGETP